MITHNGVGDRLYTDLLRSDEMRPEDGKEPATKSAKERAFQAAVRVSVNIWRQENTSLLEEQKKARREWLHS